MVSVKKGHCICIPCLFKILNQFVTLFGKKFRKKKCVGIENEP
jgi:hypothetical protein